MSHQEAQCIFRSPVESRGCKTPETSSFLHQLYSLKGLFKESAPFMNDRSHTHKTRPPVYMCVCVCFESADVDVERAVSQRLLPSDINAAASGRCGNHPAATWVNTERCRGKATGQSAED